MKKATGRRGRRPLPEEDLKMRNVLNSSLPQRGRCHGLSVTDEEITVCANQKMPSSFTASGPPSPLEKAWKRGTNLTHFPLKAKTNKAFLILGDVTPIGG